MNQVSDTDRQRSYQDYPSDYKNPQEFSPTDRQRGSQEYTSDKEQKTPTSYVTKIENVELGSFKQFQSMINDINYINDVKTVPPSLTPGEDYSTVSFVHARGLDKYIAVKIIHIRDEDHLKAVNREIILLDRYFKNTNIHPNLLKYIGTFKMDKEDDQQQNIVILVSEALSPDNKNLKTLLTKKYIKGDIRNPHLLKLFYSLLHTIQSIHEHDIVHTDIWPPNIVFDTLKNKILLVDFGESCLITKEGYPEYLMCKESTRRSHIDYMPPEILRMGSKIYKKGLNPEDMKDLDIYALAATMYELFNPNNAPLINIKLYADIHENQTTFKRFILDLEHNIDALKVGDDLEKPEFQQLVIKMLKSRKERDTVRNTPVQEKQYEDLQLSELINEEKTTPERGKTQTEQFVRAWGVQRNLYNDFCESQDTGNISGYVNGYTTCESQETGNISGYVNGYTTY
jgi:serine/threonine protein kinase